VRGDFSRPFPGTANRCRKEAQIRRLDRLAQPAIEGRKNGLADGRKFSQNIYIPKSQDSPTALRHEAVTHTVGSTIDVLAAVDFDNQTSAATGKVSEVRRYGMLPNKLVASKLSVLEGVP